MRAVHRSIEQGSNHHDEPRNDRNWFNASTGNHLLLDAESQAGRTGVSKKRGRLWRPLPDSNRNRRFRKPELYPVELRGQKLSVYQDAHSR